MNNDIIPMVIKKERQSMQVTSAASLGWCWVTWATVSGIYKTMFATKNVHLRLKKISKINR